MGNDDPPPYPGTAPYPPVAAQYAPPPAQQGFINPADQQQLPYPGAQQQYPPIQQQYPPQPTQQYGPLANLNAAQGAAAGIIKNNYNFVGSDEPVDGMGGFDDKAIRRGFIRKVYGILMCQLLITGGVIALFMFVEGVKTYVQRNMWVYFTSIGVMLVCLLAMACCESVRRKSPTNFIFLGVFTVCEGIMLGTVATYYQADAVLIAVAITCGVTFALTIFAFQTKIDFTTCGGGLCAVLVIFILAGFALAFFPQTKWTMIGYGSAGALIFSLYIIYDTQLMMGGKHKYSLSPEEYVFASLNLYLDVINLFLYILMIVGASKSD